MGRYKHETEEQYQKRLRQAEKERKVLSYAPYFWLTLVVAFFVWSIFFHDEYQDPLYPPEPPKPYYLGR